MTDTTTNMQNKGLTEMAGGEEAAREQMAILLKMNKNMNNSESDSDSESNSETNTQDLNFGPHASILSLIEATDQQLQKSEFFVQQSKDTQSKLLPIVQTLRKIHVSICTKLTEKMTDDPYITAKNIAAGSKSLQKQITKATKDFEQTIKEWSESSLKPGETYPEETDIKVHDEETVKPDLTCTRICNEFKTGIPCTHHKCTFSHSFATFSPIQCKHDGSCARLKSCECRHTMICQATGNKSLETPEQVVSRLNLVKPFPQNDQPKIVQSSVPVFNAKASRDQQRQNYKKHQAQLKALDERQKLLTRVNNPVTKKSTYVEKTIQPQPQSTVHIVQPMMQQPMMQQTVQPQQPSPAVSVMSGTTMVEQIPHLSLPETVSEIDKRIRDAVAAENYSLAQTLKDKKTVMQESKPMQNRIQCSASQAIEIMKMMTQSGMSTQNMNFQIV